MAQQAQWQNRIIGHGEEAPDQLLANPKNWRIHPQTQQAALEAVLQRVGWVQQVVVNQRTGHMLDGHLRVTLALRKEEPKVPVIYVDLSPEEEDLILASLDPLSAMAVTDSAQLKDLVEALAVEDGALKTMFDDLLLAAGALPAPPPSADALAAEHGDPDPTVFWPEIKLKVSPETHELYQSLMGRMEGGYDSEKFAALLARVSLA